MIDQILDTVLILIIAYGHIVVFIDTGRMAEMSKMKRLLEGRLEGEPERAKTPKPVVELIDGYTPVDRSQMFSSDTSAVKGAGRKVPVITNGKTRYVTL